MYVLLQNLMSWCGVGGVTGQTVHPRVEEGFSFGQRPAETFPKLLATSTWDPNVQGKEFNRKVVQTCLVPVSMFAFRPDIRVWLFFYPYVQLKK